MPSAGQAGVDCVGRASAGPRDRHAISGLGQTPPTARTGTLAPMGPRLSVAAGLAAGGLLALAIVAGVVLFGPEIVVPAPSLAASSSPAPSEARATPSAAPTGSPEPSAAPS